MKNLSFSIEPELASVLFLEISEIRKKFPGKCLTEHLWSDTSEKANGITRDVATNTLCYTMGIYDIDGKPIEHYSLRETSLALLGSKLYNTVAELIANYETV